MKNYSTKGFKLKEVKNKYYLYKYDKKKSSYISLGNIENLRIGGRYYEIAVKLLKRRIERRKKKKEK